MVDEQMFFLRGEKMVLEDWRQATAPQNTVLPPVLPVLFHVNGTEALQPGDYCEGQEVRQDRYWDSQEGWNPCLMVELGEAF